MVGLLVNQAQYVAAVDVFYVHIEISQDHDWVPWWEVLQCVAQLVQECCH